LSPVAEGGVVAPGSELFPLWREFPISFQPNLGSTEAAWSARLRFSLADSKAELAHRIGQAAAGVGVELSAESATKFADEVLVLYFTSIGGHGMALY
jgi:hypothetical protein